MRVGSIFTRLAAAIWVMVGVSGIRGAETGQGDTTGVDLRLLPEEVVLHGPEATQQLLAVWSSGGEALGQAESVTFVSDAPEVASVTSEGIVEARGDGSACITATSGDRSARLVVAVSSMDAPWRWSFRNHVLPVLSKAGCNAGACHGSLAGKGGFRLSLRGYDPEADYHTITREARGRRVEAADPARSLLLTKPTTAVRHKGGHKLDEDSRDYRVVAEWISQGLGAPSEEDAKLVRLEVVPARSLLEAGDAQRLVVRGFYSDGRSEDVTRWVKFESADETVAKVNDDGTVTVTGHGEGAITAWFSSQIVIAHVTVPFEYSVAADVFAEAESANFIDEHVNAQLQRLRLAPSPIVDDLTFLRRASLDTIGRLPTADEVRAFRDDAGPDKRARLVERLLGSDAFVDYWAYKWSDMLLINGRLLRPEAVRAYYQWVRGQVAANTPWDEFARRIVTAVGDSFENGATNFFAVHQDPETMAENVSQAFLSLSINCARCHNHPLEKWTNDQYYAFANLFSRVQAKGWGGEPRNGDGRRTVYVEPRGDLVQPRTGRPQPPAPLDGEPLDPDAPGDRRVVLADWLTSPDNPYFARAITNRVWANFFGVGLVEPVDDLRVSNPASNEPLFEAASRHLADHGFDLKALMREILTSAAYQRDSRPLAENAGDSRYFARYYPRRLMAEVLHDAISDVTGVPTDFNTIAFPGGDVQKTDFYPQGTRALQLYDSAVASYFLSTFGRNERDITCECERTSQPSMVQVLHLANGDTVNEKLRTAGNRLEEWINAGRADEEIIDEIYVSALSRLPTEDERQRIAGVLAEPETDRRAALEDVFWAVLSSREFLFNH